MIKTHAASRFELKTLQEIYSSADVILQIQETDSNSENGELLYLCEVVRFYEYGQTQTVGTLAEKLSKANEENRRLQNRIAELEKELDRLLSEKLQESR